jgi:hypothetical protein
MRILIATAALLLTVPTLARAGNADDSSVQGQFYFFTAPIVSNTRYYYNPQTAAVCYPGLSLPQPCPFTAVGGTDTGFGGELLVRKGVGVGVELGYAGPNWNFDKSGLGMGSVDGSYHFFGSKSRRGLDPFATGGYSLYFGQRTMFQSGPNLGGGVNLWLVKHVALRSEIRYQGGINHFNSPLAHYVAFRFGLTFR